MQFPDKLHVTGTSDEVPNMLSESNDGDQGMKGNGYKDKSMDLSHDPALNAANAEK